jgi:hypothetical protein
MARFGSAFVVGLVAAAAVFLSQWSGLRLWVIFVGWTGCFLFFPDIRRTAFAALHNILGVALGMLTAATIAALDAYLGSAAAPLAVFVLATGLVLLERRPPFDNIPAYFIGLSIYFASGLPAGIASTVTLSAAIVAGYLLGFATIYLRTAYERAIATTD